MSARAAMQRRRSWGLIWAVDVDKLAFLDRERVRLLGSGCTNRFYGLWFGRIAIGVWVRSLPGVRARMAGEDG